MVRRPDTLRRRAGVVLLALSLLAIPVAGHVPGFAGENTSHDTALHLEEGAKSRAIYATHEPRQARYYEVHLEPGQRLQASVFTPTPGSVTPGIVVYGPDVEPSGTPPEWVDIPEEMHARVIPGTRPPTPEFEPFTPAAYYQTAAVSLPAADDHYWIAVYEPDGSAGRVGMAVGYVETFTIVEFLLVPLELIEVHLWEGDSLILLIGPYLAALSGVGALFRGRRQVSPTSRPESLASQPGMGSRQFAGWRLGLAGASVLFLGGAGLTAIQFLKALTLTGVGGEAVLTLLFISLPMAIGVWLLVLVRRPTLDWTIRGRVLLLGAGVLGLLSWGGLLLGPVLVGLVALVPGQIAPRH